MQSLPLTKDLVLIGGGHAHALVLRKWGMNPMPGVRVTVINPGPTAPYTGMLPGHVAGHYTREELEIDLVKLGRHAGARLVLGKACGLDLEAKQVRVEGQDPIPYDVASFDVGITAQMPAIKGFAEHAVGAKPLDIFAACWRDYLGALPGGKAQIAAIGGGVAGVELALAMHHAVRQRGAPCEIAIIEAGPALSGISDKTRDRLNRALKDAGIIVHLNTRAEEICADHIRLQNGETVPATLTVGAAGAFPHTWVHELPLPLTDGFINVGADLRVSSHDDLFAVGDCAHMTASPRSKAGVFAVRAAPVLHDNFRAVLAGKPTRVFKPQSRYLKLISLGGKAAIAERGGLSFSSPLLWHWKDRIDRAFMDKFIEFPAMETPDLSRAAEGVAPIVNTAPLCGGCGAKVAGGVLQDTLRALPATARQDVTLGAGDDAAVLEIGGAKQVISTDHLRAFTEDPALLTEVAALHALGDIWAMGAQPQALLMNVTMPRMSDALQRRTMELILRSADQIAREVGAALVGGHSTMGAEMSIGFTATGLCDGAPITKAGAKPGDALILTRPLGSGVLLAGEMQMKANGRHIAALYTQMRRNPARVAAALAKAHAMTDVTGFGLAGHLAEICAASGTGAELWLDALPVYDGALELIEAGLHASLMPSNRTLADVQGAEGARGELLFDPQTAGGFLAALPEDDVRIALEDIEKAGFQAVQIGQVTPDSGKIICRPSR
ncbi:selenide, water dikinase SelD [Cognatishimia sp. MH4019]|uniref:selenide, water dikinase SelD n=1 Tax=Cognatishimia sp. MH4019 TaxID=2854030 RepID=UPI001CD3C9EE|nr:selenide, water dikinase SelD [Cognatishimia sp. MH4019]